MGECIDKRIPWFTHAAFAELPGLVKPGAHVFEWGSGGSTLWWLDRACHLITVEHDVVWSSRVSKLMSTDTRKNWCIHVAPPEQAGNPKYASVMRPGTFYEAYVEIASIYAYKTFDVVCVDGRARVACVERGLHHVRPGGLLILDNSDRRHYEPGIRLLSGWSRQDFHGHGPDGNGIKWTTTFFRKPV